VTTVESRLLALVAAAALALPAASRSHAAEWEHVRPGVELAFPRDHGAHPTHASEWWYLTGHLATAGGEDFGFQLTIFRSGMDPGPPEPGASPLRARQVYAGHLAIADPRTGRVVFAERLRRAAVGLAGGSTDDLDVHVEAWRIAREAGDRLHVAAADPAHGIALELELVPAKPLVLQGERGYSRKGAEETNASAYVSWTRLAATGRLDLAGERHAVDGTAWFDHEWGTSQLGPGVVGWDWFSLQLDDGRELMLYALRRADGTPAPFSAGTLVGADGSSVRLSRDDFAIEVRGRWESPHTGAVYPAGWTLRVPSAGLELTCEPTVPDCELRTGGSTDVTYWEGPLRVSGSAAGRGYAELTGYADSLDGRF